ncbi:MAG TPA: hypothetical protein P5077_02145 [bacterium]|nr:hypothetical protein [bacterium]
MKKIGFAFMCLVLIAPMMVGADDGPELFGPLARSARDVAASWSTARLTFAEITAQRTQLSAAFDRCKNLSGSSACLLEKEALDRFDEQNVERTRERLLDVGEQAKKSENLFRQKLRAVSIKDAAKKSREFKALLNQFLALAAFRTKLTERANDLVLRGFELAFRGISTMGGLDDLETATEQDLDRLLDERRQTLGSDSALETNLY